MISVFVPSHITGFFSIFDNENPLLKGSLGAGVLLDKGVITEIDEAEESNDDLSIIINGKRDEYNEVIILKTIELMKEDKEWDSPSAITDDHKALLTEIRRSVPAVMSAINQNSLFVLSAMQFDVDAESSPAR